MPLLGYMCWLHQTWLTEGWALWRAPCWSMHPTRNAHKRATSLLRSYFMAIMAFADVSAARSLHKMQELYLAEIAELLGQNSIRILGKLHRLARSLLSSL